MMSTLRRLLSSLLFGLLLLNGLFFLRQPAMVFYPTQELVSDPGHIGLDYRAVQFRSSDGTPLYGWYLPHTNSDIALLFLHGNGGNISHRLDSLQIFHRLGLNTLIIDYRGYGKSGGEPSETGLYRDARAGWDYLRAQGFSADRIILFGRSLGGAVAAHLATEVDAGALILESTFDSARGMAATLLPGLSNLIFLRYRFDTARKLSQRTMPLLMLHSREDRIIPFEKGERAFAAAVEPKRFVELVGDHNSGFLQSQPRYQQTLQQFIRAAVPTKP